ncbi:hypothetical protein [Glycocaulis sp.]|uniref:hypothetical protein n=1 Tax=Glycocaulis sp. TaxID=1969725 RepID=UPI0025BD24FC|nr:hypothetical protein [Glycocaulis sp.]MCH8520405.1 hypothetical protein [Glycocaulis sp.]
MTSPDSQKARIRHPLRANGLTALALLFLTIGLFIAFAFELASGGGDWPVIGGTAAAMVICFLLWARENHIANTAANAPRPPRHDLSAIRTIPVQAGMGLGYAATVLVSALYVPGLDGFFKGFLQSLPIGFLAGWVVVWIYVIRESDEMIRHLMILSTAVSAGAVLLAVTVWGLLAMHSDLPGVAEIYLFPAFAIVYAVVSAFLTRRYA